MLQCLLALNPHCTSPLLSPALCTFIPSAIGSLIRKQSFPHLLQLKGPWKASQILPLRERGPRYRFELSLTLSGSATLAEPWGGDPWAFLSLAFLAADPAGPALCPSQPGNPGGSTPSPGPESFPRVSKALPEAGQKGLS